MDATAPYPGDTGMLFLFFSGKKRNQKKPAKGKGFIALPLGTPTRETCECSVLSLLFCHRVGIVTLRHPPARFPASLTRALRRKSVVFSFSQPVQMPLVTPHPQSLPLMREVDSPQGEDGGRDYEPADFGETLLLCDTCFFSPSVTYGDSSLIRGSLGLHRTRRGENRAAISLAPCDTGCCSFSFPERKGTTRSRPRRRVS